MFNCELCEHWCAPKCVAQNITLARGHHVLNCNFYKTKKMKTFEEFMASIARKRENPEERKSEIGGGADNL